MTEDTNRADYMAFMDDLRRILTNDYGRRFVWEFLQKCGIFRTSMTGNSVIYYREGMRAVGLMLLQDVIATGPEFYIKMIQENMEAKDIWTTDENAKPRTREYYED